MVILGLARDIGYDAVDGGPLRSARWLETLGFFDIQLGYDAVHGSAGHTRFQALLRWRLDAFASRAQRDGTGQSQELREPMTDDAVTGTSEQ